MSHLLFFYTKIKRVYKSKKRTQWKKRDDLVYDQCIIREFCTNELLFIIRGSYFF